MVDIQVSVSSLQPLSPYLVPLGHIGYVHIPFCSFNLVYPFFQKPAEWPCTHHIHLCVVGSEQERKHLAFRDYLRDHPLLGAEHVQLKRQLAAAHHGTTLESREKYSLAKTEFASASTRFLLSQPPSEHDMNASPASELKTEVLFEIHLNVELPAAQPALVIARSTACSTWTFGRFSAPLTMP